MAATASADPYAAVPMKSSGSGFGAGGGSPDEQQELERAKKRWEDGASESLRDSFKKDAEKDALAKSYVEEATHSFSEQGVAISFKDLTYEVRLRGEKAGSNTPFAGCCEPGEGRCQSCCCASTCPDGCGCGSCKACGCCCEHRPSKMILKCIHNHIPAGSMVALMGASGAGKTSLLNVLARRNRGNGGEVLYNGLPPSDDDVAKLVAYIQQEDMFFGNLTVKEHLEIQGRLRLPKQYTTSAIKGRVERLIDRMQLTKCKDSKIGNAQMGEGRGISGGEKKRLNIASELITAPSIVFADEPTTGLDSFIAYTAIGVLRQLADRGHTIICTIHQPNTKIFELFDTLLLMGEGHILYAGDRLGGVKWFESLGHPCPISTNPADFLIKLVAVTDTNREKKLKIIDKWAETWKNSGQDFLKKWMGGERAAFIQRIGDYDKKRIDAVIGADEEEEKSRTSMPRKSVASSFHRTQSIQSGSFNPNEDPLRPMPDGAATKETFDDNAPVIGERINCCQQFSVLLRRASISASRDPILLFIRAMQTLIMAVIIGFLFFRLDWSSHGSQTKLATCFSILMNQAMASSLSVVQVFPEETPLARREYDSGILNVFAYFSAKNIAEVPIMVFFPIVFAVITYYLTGLNDNFVRFLIVTVVIILNANTALSIGYFASCIAPSTDAAMAIATIILLPLILLGGFLMNPEDVAYFWVVIQHISPFWYGFSAISATVFHNVVLDFDRVAYDAAGNPVGTVPATGDYFLVERAHWPYWEHDLTIDGETVLRRRFYVWTFFALLIMILFCRNCAAIALWLVFRYTKKEGS